MLVENHNTNGMVLRPPPQQQCSFESHPHFWNREKKEQVTRQSSVDNISHGLSVCADSNLNCRTANCQPNVGEVQQCYKMDRYLPGPGTSGCQQNTTESLLSNNKRESLIKGPWQQVLQNQQPTSGVQLTTNADQLANMNVLPSSSRSNLHFTSESRWEEKELPSQNHQRHRYHPFIEQSFNIVTNASNKEVQKKPDFQKEIIMPCVGERFETSDFLKVPQVVINSPPQAMFNAQANHHAQHAYEMNAQESLRNNASYFNGYEVERNHNSSSEVDFLGHISNEVLNTVYDNGDSNLNGMNSCNDRVTDSHCNQFLNEGKSTLKSGCGSGMSMDLLKNANSEIKNLSPLTFRNTAKVEYQFKKKSAQSEKLLVLRLHKIYGIPATDENLDVIHHISIVPILSLDEDFNAHYKLGPYPIVEPVESLSQTCQLSDGGFEIPYRNNTEIQLRLVYHTDFTSSTLGLVGIPIPPYLKESQIPITVGTRSINVKSSDNSIRGVLSVSLALRFVSVADNPFENMSETNLRSELQQPQLELISPQAELRRQLGFLQHLRSRSPLLWREPVPPIRKQSNEEFEENEFLAGCSGQFYETLNTRYNLVEAEAVEDQPAQTYIPREPINVINTVPVLPREDKSKRNLLQPKSKTKTKHHTRPKMSYMTLFAGFCMDMPNKFI